MWGVFAGEAMLARYVVNTLLLNIGLWMAGPLFVVYTVRQLGASDAWIGTSGTVASVCGLVGWMVGRHLVERWGEAATQRRIVTLVGLYPLLVGLFPNLTIILIIGGVYNLLTPSFSLSNYNLWLKIAPAQRREEVTAINNTIMSIGAAIFPLAGVALSNWFGVAPVLIGCGVLATLGALAFWAWKIVV